MTGYTEAKFEKAVIELFRDKLGYGYLYGPEVTRDYADPLLDGELKPSLRRVNPSLPEAALKEAERLLRGLADGPLTERNRMFTDWLQNGVSVNFRDNGGRTRSAVVRLADYGDAERNSFRVANQWTVKGNCERRPDVVVFLNGLPVAVFELKSPSREETDVSEAYRQLRNYMQDIPALFAYNAFLVMTDFATSKAGTITAGEDRFMEWKSKDGARPDAGSAGFVTLIEGMFEKRRLLDIVRNFICFSGEDVKILGAYHQYFAVRRAVDSTARAAARGDGKGGVFWHTQGSGKSLSMVFYAHLLREALESPTLVVLNDRNDLDGQLFGQFAKCADFLRQTPLRAESRAHLRELLEGREANGIIFTTMQKFEESPGPLSRRGNIVVLADEAHRGQYGLGERADPATGRVSAGTARVIRDSLPNATYIGFTGTPISLKDRSTVEVFGNYIDVYDMTQAVEDGATCPVYYESRVVHLKLDEDILRRIDAEYDVMARDAAPGAVEKSKRMLGRLESILGAEETVSALCGDIVRHYEENRQGELTGKAMIVAYSRPIAMKIYRKLLELRPGWTEKVGVVMTESNNDPESWRPVIGNGQTRKKTAERFKDDAGPMKIAIVVDMWLTGFDLPSLATMYVYKPMSGHNLMQAIARVNRVYKGKEGGLVVDYVGIAPALKQAMVEYTVRDRKNYGDPDIAKTAYPKFLEKIEVCRGLFHGFDYSVFISPEATNLDRARVISGGADFLSAPGRAPAESGGADGADRLAAESPSWGGGYGEMPGRKDTFIKEAQLLRQARSLCGSMLSRRERFEAAYFEAVRTLLTRLAGKGKPLSLKEINSRIGELLKAGIQSDGVINLFADVKTGFSLFDPKFLEEVAKIKARNLAVEILRKLLSEQVSLYRRTNLVKSEKFSALLSLAMRRYINGMISNEEVIEELLKMARDMADAAAEGKAMGLDAEEAAFYDALTLPEAVKDFYRNDELVAMTRALTDMLRKNRTVDWQKRESARAHMRRMVKKLLKKFKYPPEGMEDAVKTVIGQCEMWTDNPPQAVPAASTW